MNYSELTQDDFNLIRKIYNKFSTRNKAQEKLSDKYNVSKRTIRNWARHIGLGVTKQNIINPLKILIYDIETSRVPAMVWWTGKQFINHDQLKSEPNIITIAWKWLGEDDVKHLTWDKNHSDKKMVSEFIKIYNEADMVIGQNNDRFDNRWVQSRAAKYDLEINNYIRSFDIMKESKRMFRLPSYSMKYMCKYFDVEQKLEHEGIKMWDKIQSGTSEEQEEYLQKMVNYNVGDIISTEALYYRLRKYFGHKIHLGVLNGEKKYACPTNGSLNISLYKTTVTPAGTLQRIMRCNVDGVKYKITNKQYMDFLDYKMKNKNIILEN